MQKILSLHQECQLDLLVVLDGNTPPVKRAQCQFRKQRRHDAAERVASMTCQKTGEATGDDGKQDKTNKDDGSLGIEESIQLLRHAKHAGASLATSTSTTSSTPSFFTLYPEIIQGLLQALRQERVSFLVAPYEADAQLAFLVKEGFVDVVISNDSDLVLTIVGQTEEDGEYKRRKNKRTRKTSHGTTGVILKFNPFTHQGVFFSKADWHQSSTQAPQHYYHHLHSTTNRTPSTTTSSTAFCISQFTPVMNMIMAVAAGCDYCDNLPGIGIVKARQIVEEAFFGDADVLSMSMSSTSSVSSPEATPPNKANMHAVNHLYPYAPRDKTHVPQQQQQQQQQQKPHPLEKVFTALFSKTRDTHLQNPTHQTSYKQSFLHALVAYLHPIVFDPQSRTCRLAQEHPFVELGGYAPYQALFDKKKKEKEQEGFLEGIVGKRVVDKRMAVGIAEGRVCPKRYVSYEELLAKKKKKQDEDEKKEGDGGGKEEGMMDEDGSKSSIVVVGVETNGTEQEGNEAGHDDEAWMHEAKKEGRADGFSKDLSERVEKCADPNVHTHGGNESGGLENGTHEKKNSHQTQEAELEDIVPKSKEHPRPKPVWKEKAQKGSKSNPHDADVEKKKKEIENVEESTDGAKVEEMRQQRDEPGHELPLHKAKNDKRATKSLDQSLYNGPCMTLQDPIERLEKQNVHTLSGTSRRGSNNKSTAEQKRSKGKEETLENMVGKWTKKASMAGRKVEARISSETYQHGKDMHKYKEEKENVKLPKVDGAVGTSEGNAKMRSETGSARLSFHKLTEEGSSGSLSKYLSVPLLEPLERGEDYSVHTQNALVRERPKGKKRTKKGSKEHDSSDHKAERAFRNDGDVHQGNPRKTRKTAKIKIGERRMSQAIMPSCQEEVSTEKCTLDGKTSRKRTRVSSSPGDPAGDTPKKKPACKISATQPRRPRIDVLSSYQKECGAMHEESSISSSCSNRLDMLETQQLPSSPKLLNKYHTCKQDAATWYDDKGMYSSEQQSPVSLMAQVVHRLKLRYSFAKSPKENKRRSKKKRRKKRDKLSVS